MKHNKKVHLTMRGRLVVLLITAALTIFSSLAAIMLNNKNLINQNQQSLELSLTNLEPPDCYSPYRLPKQDSDLILIAKLTKTIGLIGFVLDIVEAYELALAVYTYGKEYNHLPLLLLAIVRTLSCFSKSIISRGNCRGYFQINYGVYRKQLTLNFLDDVFLQTHMACYVLLYTRNIAKGNITKMINGYNGWWSNSNPYAGKVLGYKKQYEDIYKKVTR